MNLKTENKYDFYFVGYFVVMLLFFCLFMWSVWSGMECMYVINLKKKFCMK